MPAPKYTAPEFSLVGRYLIDVSLRKAALEAGNIPVFHDTQNFKEECELTGATTNYSRFNNMKWALESGFGKCNVCFDS